MLRFASECSRQHRRYARIVEMEAGEAEQRGALWLVEVCDELLAAAARDYEKSAAAEPRGYQDADWWRPANSLWMACRDYARRNRQSDLASSQLQMHGQDKLNELAVEYDLVASALLGLQHAVGAYRKARPMADVNYAPARS